MASAVVGAAASRDGDGRNPLAEKPVSLAAPGMYDWYHDPTESHSRRPDVRHLARKLKDVYKETDETSSMDDESLSPQSGLKDTMSDISTSTTSRASRRKQPSYMQPTVVSIAKRKSLQRRLREYRNRGRGGRGGGRGSFDGTSDRSDITSVDISTLDTQELMQALEMADDSALGKDTPRELGEWKANGSVRKVGPKGRERSAGKADSGATIAVDACGKEVLCVPAIRTGVGKAEATKGDDSQEGGFSSSEEVTFRFMAKPDFQEYASVVLETDLPQSFDENDTEGKPNAANGPMLGEKEITSFGSEFSGSPTCASRETLDHQGPKEKSARPKKRRTRFSMFACCVAPTVAE